MQASYRTPLTQQAATTLTASLCQLESNLFVQSNYRMTQCFSINFSEFCLSQCGWLFWVSLSECNQLCRRRPCATILQEFPTGALAIFDHMSLKHVASSTAGIADYGCTQLDVYDEGQRKKQLHQFLHKDYLLFNHLITC